MNNVSILEQMKNIDPRTVDRSTLVERKSVKLDPNATPEERQSSYVEQIKNPYCFLQDGSVTKISFTNTGKSMVNCMLDYLRGL